MRYENDDDMSSDTVGELIDGSRFALLDQGNTVDSILFWPHFLCELVDWFSVYRKSQGSVFVEY